MITYADVQRMYRIERSSPSLQKIPENFYSELTQLLSQIGEEHREYITQLAREIYERRRNKIVIHALRSSEPPMNIISPEKELYDEIAETLRRYRKKLLLGEQEKEVAEPEPGVIERREEEPEIEGPERMKIRFLRSLPSIIGSDMVHYGPFKEGDVVELPKDNARILMDREIAEEI